MADTTQFSIGDFTFDSFHAYRDGQEDLKKIEAINARLDVQDPEVAVRLYNMIRNGEIGFKTDIGDDFAAHVADIVAEKSKGFIDDETVVSEANAQARTQRIAGVAIAVLAAALFSYFGVTTFSDWKETRKMSALRDTVAEAEADGGKASSFHREGANSAGNASVAEETDPFTHVEKVDPASLSVLPEYEEAFAQNADMVGWIRIPDTQIDYPVTQRADDNEYYLNHAFDGSDSSAGTLFADFRSDIVNPTTNTIIYGHNMKNDTMFGAVDNYLDKGFYAAHKEVDFNTIFEHRRYEIVAVCLAEVAYQDENSYRYYNFIQASNQAEWNAFFANIKALSIYGKDIDLVKTDQVLTLSTCNNYVQDGRLFLVAKRVE